MLVGDKHFLIYYNNADNDLVCLIITKIIVKIIAKIIINNYIATVIW